MEATITVQCGKSSSRGQYGRCNSSQMQFIKNSILGQFLKSHKIAIKCLMFVLIPFCCVTLGQLLTLSVLLFSHL